MISISKPIIEKEEISAVMTVLKSGMIVQGPKTKELEDSFADFCGAKYAVAVNSGTAALHASLYALGIGEGDEVITTPFTFVATANPVLMQNAKVVFADISEEDFCLDPIEVSKKITKKTKAVIPVDLYGQIYDYPGLKKVLRGSKIKILEDACQAVGAEYKGKKAGLFGDAAAFSLYATKNMMSGEGGLVVTDSREIADQVKQFRHHGQSETVRYQYNDLGYNYRINDMLSAMALEQLKKVNGFNKKRRNNAEKLTKGLKDIKGLILPEVKKGYEHVFHQYTIRVTPEFGKTRDELMEYLKDAGIGSGIYYPKPLHLHKHFLKMGYKKGDFPVSEKLSGEVLSLPVHPLLTDKEITTIIKKIREIK